MQQRLVRTLLVSLAASGLLAASLNANARAIRFDGGDGGGAWTLPEVSSDASTDVGFTFNLLGTSAITLTINANGSVSFGGALIAPFLDATQSLSYSYSTTTESPDFGGNIPSAIRINWFSDADDDNNDNQFQLAIFDLGNGDFVMEFNYANIDYGSDARSSIGYDNGAGVSFDLLATLGVLEGFGGPLPFDEYMGIGVDFLDENGNFDENDLLCADPALILACNNFYAVTGEFGPDASLLPTSFPGLITDFGNFFQVDPSFGEPAQGRYVFLIDNPEPVPEPGTLWLLSIGLVGLAISRRRRRGASYIS